MVLYTSRNNPGASALAAELEESFAGITRTDIPPASLAGLTLRTPPSRFGFSTEFAEFASGIVKDATVQVVKGVTETKTMAACTVGDCDCYVIAT